MPSVRHLLAVLLCAACVMTGVPLSGATAEDPVLSVGDLAPDFRLAGSDGRTYTLAEFRGTKPVVIAWFPKAMAKTWLLECERPRVGSPELPTLDVAFFEASVDAPETNQRLAELLDLGHPILSDPDKAVARAYGVLAGGRRTALRWTFYVGIDGRIVFIDKAVIADGHGEEVPAQLRALGLAQHKPAGR